MLRRNARLAIIFFTVRMSVFASVLDRWLAADVASSATVFDHPGDFRPCRNVERLQLADLD